MSEYQQWIGVVETGLDEVGVDRRSATRSRYRYLNTQHDGHCVYLNRKSLWWGKLSADGEAFGVLVRDESDHPRLGMNAGCVSGGVLHHIFAPPEILALYPLQASRLYELLPDLVGRKAVTPQSLANPALVLREILSIFREI